MKFAALLAFLLSAPALAAQSPISCHSGVVGPNGYGYAIELNGADLTIQQSSVNARYAPIHQEVNPEATLEAFEGAPKFSCTSEEGPNKYFATLQVFEDRVVLLQSSENARYAPLTFAFVTEVEEDVQEESYEFSCQSVPTGRYKYSYSIELKDGKASILQQSMNARYAPIQHTIVKNDALELPEGKARFACVKKGQHDNYRAQIKVYADRIFVLQSSTSARYAPLAFEIVAE